MKKKILLTAFDPFGGEAKNSTEEVCQKLSIEDARIELYRQTLPTVFGKSVDLICRTIDALQPDAVILLGQAGGRKGITPERVAINIADASIEDNAGNRPIDEPNAIGGPAAYFSTLPIKAIVSALNEKEITASVSNTAGTFVCNHLMYCTLHHLASMGNPAIAGFIHLPYLSEQAAAHGDAPSMETETMIEALRCILSVVADHLG
jgi:pyroglutamyl-peptidase